MRRAAAEHRQLLFEIWNRDCRDDDDRGDKFQHKCRHIKAQRDRIDQTEDKRAQYHAENPERKLSPSEEDVPDRLVLTKYKDRPVKHYALVAGFNEIGESIEETVHREVLEETGLRVRNLRFYKSQPWVFTDTLLFGFFAELDGSDKITVQEDELSEAGWFYRSEIPEDRTHLSLTGEMMEQFRKGLA